MKFTEQEVREIYYAELQNIRSLNKDESDKIISKYSKEKLIAMVSALYSEDTANSMRNKNKHFIINSIRMMIEGIDRAQRLKP